MMVTSITIGHCDDDCDYDGADDFDADFTFDNDYDVMMILTLTMMSMLVLMVTMMMTLIMTGTVTMKIKGGVFDEDDYCKTEHLVFCSVKLVISIVDLSTWPNQMEWLNIFEDFLHLTLSWKKIIQR